MLRTFTAATSRLTSAQLRISTRICFSSTRSSQSLSLRGYSTKRYTEQHEWVSVENNIGTVGISKYAADSLGDVVYVELPEVGVQFNQGDQIGAVESVKAASDIYAPISGEVTEINSDLSQKPALINKSPEDDAWLCRIKLTEPDQVNSLMDETAYQEFAKEE